MFVATGCMAAVYATVAADDNKKPEEDGGGEGGDLAGQNDYKGCLSMGIFWFMKKEEGATLSQDIRKRRVARQAFWYLLAFYMSWLFVSIVRGIEAANIPVPYPLSLLTTIFFPLQGTFNWLVYIRPRFLRNREKNPDWSAWRCITSIDEKIDAELGARRMRSTMVARPKRSFLASLRRSHLCGSSAAGNNAREDERNDPSVPKADGGEES